jgi:hypothetical protein
VPTGNKSTSAKARHQSLKNSNEQFKISEKRFLTIRFGVGPVRRRCKLLTIRISRLTTRHFAAIYADFSEKYLQTSVTAFGEGKTSSCELGADRQPLALLPRHDKPLLPRNPRWH